MKKAEKFQRELEKGSKLSKKVERGKDPGQYIAPSGWIIARGHLQKTRGGKPNPCVTGPEGFFILKSSIDDEPAKILDTCKNRDMAEKFIRDLKEGAEIRPVRHWSNHAVIGFVLIVFPTKVLVSLTQFFCKNHIVKNLNVLKNFLTNLTLTIVCPRFGFGVRLISNFLPELRPLFGDFIKKQGSLELPDRW
jgi:transposase